LIDKDADHEFLMKLISEFQFSVARPELLRIIDDVLNAKEPPAPILQAPD
jgi:hypothetical protein